MPPELNQMSFRKIKELILEVVNMVDNTIFISVKDIMKTLTVPWKSTNRRIYYV